MIIDNETSARQRGAGIAIHLVTASGAIAGLFALQNVVNNHIRSGLIWLVICQVLDGIDGPIARRLDVTLHAPMIDGHVLDLIIDYVSCVVVPIALMLKLNVLPTESQMVVAALMIFTSALWFARTDQETPDNWFNGFPAGWNIVVPTLIILGINQRLSVLIVITLCFAQLSNIAFPHIVRVRALRKLTYSAASIYMISLTTTSIMYPNSPTWAHIALYLGPIYLTFIVIWRTWFSSVSLFGQSVTTSVRR